MPRQFTWLCTSGALTLLIHIAAAQAEATRPNDDQLVLGQARPTSTQQSGVANLAADRDNLELAVAVALSLIHISEPTRLLSISYAVFCLKKKKNTTTHNYTAQTTTLLTSNTCT